tara:strand:- start:815 stop:1042 length:228 start_codon:yes stop_codon:yes gene_type:complete
MTENEIINHAVSVGQECRVETWMELKKLMLVSLPPKDRSNFSRRDPKTKKQQLNDFERKLIDNYCSRTGTMLKGL